MNNPAHPLQFEAKRLLQGPVEFDFEVEASHFEIYEDPEFNFNYPIKGTIKATSAGGDTVLVTTDLSTFVSASCVRCLDKIKIPINARVQQAWFVDPGEQKKALEGDEEKLYFDGNVLDPTESLREEIMIQLPSFPRCSKEKNPECAADTEASRWTFESKEPKKSDKTNKETESWIGQLDSIKEQIGKN